MTDEELHKELEEAGAYALDALKLLMGYMKARKLNALVLVVPIVENAEKMLSQGHLMFTDGINPDTQRGTLISAVRALSEYAKSTAAHTTEEVREYRD